MMTAVSTEMVKRVRESLEQTPVGGLYPLKDMAGHFSSTLEIPNSNSLKQVFVVEVDNKKVFVYLQVT